MSFLYRRCDRLYRSDGLYSANIIINVIQILALVTFSASRSLTGFSIPALHYLASQCLERDYHLMISVAYLPVHYRDPARGRFESATALAAEAKNPRPGHSPWCFLSLVIQAVIFYFLEYFAANFFINDGYKNAQGKLASQQLLVQVHLSAIWRRS